MKKEAQQLLVTGGLWLFGTIALFYLSRYFIMLLLFAVVSAFVGGIMLPLFLASAVRRNIEYALMMEKLHLVNIRFEDTYILGYKRIKRRCRFYGKRKLYI